MLKINGTGTGMSGRKHPDKIGLKMFCDRCKRQTWFTKKIGVEKFYFFWFPLPTNDEEQVYWQCDRCDSFIRYGDFGPKDYTLPGNKGGVLRHYDKHKKGMLRENNSLPYDEIRYG